MILHEETILQPFTAPPLAHRISMLSGMLVVKGRSTSKMTQEWGGTNSGMHYPDGMQPGEQTHLNVFFTLGLFIASGLADA